MEIQDFAGLGALPIVIGVTQVIKNTFPTSPNYVTVGVALVVAEVVSEAVAFEMHTDGILGAILGVVVWLASMGLWSGTKAVVNSIRNPNPNPNTGAK